jgi:hypothetical protein
MLRSVPKERVSKHGAAPILRDAALCAAPQDEGGIHDVTFSGFTLSLSKCSPIACAMKRAVIGVPS